MIECYFGGSLARELEAEGGDAFARLAIDQIAAHLGADIRKRLSPIFGSAWGRDPWALGAYSYARPGDAGARAVLAETVDDRLFFAGEACSVNDYLDGARGVSHRRDGGGGGSQSFRETRARRAQ